jgi:type I restriction-modification system DNA methylase subunit
MPVSVSYEQARDQVARLVERFAGLTARNRKHYNEAATRQEFILPLFRALGWTVDDSHEVSPEEQVSRGFVDFAFRLGGIPRFFLETKKIPADLDDPRWAQQAINYAWLKGVTWAVLSDFEGLKVFNAEWQESIPARAIFKDLDWRHYLDRFDDLWLLSPPAIADGALDRAAEAVGRKAKKTPVSRLLFADLTEWRRELFRHLRPYNPLWSVEQIDEAVQRILDRLIFIRTCEDRGIEEARLLPMLRQWRDQGRKKDLVKQLNALFREFDAAYDSRLFAPHLCEELTSEPAPYERIIEGLYQVPGGYGQYDFNAIDADVLGTIYEQYLGHRAQDPEGRQVVDKRAKRKAQGIYYTPQFVVRYIVGQTLGRYLQEHDYRQARQVKVLDMACGSGSFLIEAFDLLDRYLAGIRTPLSQALGEPRAPLRGASHGPGVRADMHDFARRMEILSANLYGVDLDAQAVEIARLNLLLKAVNRRGLLPSLDAIRQGNSLIGGSPADLEAAFGPAWRDKHPFNWAEEFPAVFAPPPPGGGGQGGGGFDVIVGNPPYIRIQTLPKDDAAWYGDAYQAASGSYDIYVLFVERALQLLRPGGVMGFILPNKFFQASYGQRLRALLSEQKAVWQVVDFGDAQVFEDATTYTCLLFLRKAHNLRIQYYSGESVVKSGEAVLDDSLPGFVVQSNRLSEEPWTFQVEEQDRLHTRLVENGVRLGGLIARNAQGLRTGANDVFVVQRGEVLGLETNILRPLLRGEDIKRFLIGTPRQYIIFPYVSEQGAINAISANTLRKQYPACWERLCRGRKTLEARDRGKMADEKRWYTYSRNQNLDLVDSPKIVTPDIAPRAAFALDEEGRYALVSGYGITLPPGSAYSLKYILGLLNSKLLDSYLKSVSTRLRGGFYRYFSQFVNQLPIRRIDFSDAADVARHDRMAALVEDMLRLQAELAYAEAHKEDRRHDLARQVESTDRQIDALVYELYGLTGEEIKLVEGERA